MSLSIRRPLGVALAAAALTPLLGGTASAQTPASTAPDYGLINPGGQGEPAVLPEANETLTSALKVDLRRNFARLPLHRATVRGTTAYYVLTDVSDRDEARRLGLNFSPKLRNLLSPECPSCVQTLKRGTEIGEGTVTRPGMPNFAPTRRLTPGPADGFPALDVAPGATGGRGYSPYVRVRGSNVVYNAPIVAYGRAPFNLRAHNRTHDRLVGIDVRRRTVDMNVVRAFSHGRDILYLSFESSNALTATLDRSTFTPGLGLSPAPDGSRDPESARSSIFVFANGQTGRTSPPGQGNDHVITDGLNARPLDLEDEELVEALRVGGDAHNVLDSFPTLSGGQAELYSPLWDVNIAVWSDAAVADGLNTTQTDANQIRRLAARGLVTSPGGGPLRSDRSILNCPAVGFLSVAPAEDQAPAPEGGR